MKKIHKVESDIIEFSSLETKCVYLPNERMKIRYKYIQECSKELGLDLVKRGWRRFGNYYSRPECTSCDKCISLRIDVQNFQFSKSVRKVISKNRDTKIKTQTPSVTNEHIDLYKKYHKHMHHKKGWEYYDVSKNSYHDLYVKGFSNYGKEMLYFANNKLVAVDLVDFLDDGLSAIYFFYDPDFSKLSLGNYSIYKQIEVAKKKDLKWIYLGYYVQDCDSLNYKAKYKPYQILKNLPELDEREDWEFSV